MQATAIEVHDLHKSYDDQPVVRGITFAVEAGEIFGIAGGNGAGKTTTVEILQGLRSRDAGRVEVLGLDPARHRGALRRQVGAQLQTAALPDRLRVGEALRLFARLAGDRVDTRGLVEAWRLEPLLDKPYATLSGGQRQRLFLALALVNRPQLIFLDELTQGLDPAGRRETWRLIEQARDGGATVVLVTHDLEEAERLCDRVAVMVAGTLLACGRPGDLVASGGTVAARFSAPSATALEGLERVPGVAELAFDGTIAEVIVAPPAVVPLAAELARRELVPNDFTVLRPSLEDAVVSLLEGGPR
ncbi:MAG TPA: ABC transporter ATP-binding protein [Capillimicrobium sp.]|jgi:ABC-2 type transport system ATP-binding protein